MNTNSKLRACLTIILTFVMGWMYADSITLPGFKTKDDIADKVISDLTSFAQTTGDFTLEAKAKAGVAITLKFGNISYTPSASGFGWQLLCSTFRQYLFSIVWLVRRESIL
jgi:hypothetical protein